MKSANVESRKLRRRSKWAKLLVGYALAIMGCGDGSETDSETDTQDSIEQAITSQQNLLTQYNPSFETGTTHWFAAPTNVATLKQKALSNEHVGEVVANCPNGNNCYFSVAHNWVKVQGDSTHGITYMATVYVAAPRSSPSYKKSVTLALVERNSQGTVVSTAYSMKSQQLTETFQKLYVFKLVTASNHYLSLVVSGIDASKGNFYVNDASLVALTRIEPNKANYVWSPDSNTMSINYCDIRAYVKIKHDGVVMKNSIVRGPDDSNAAKNSGMQLVQVSESNKTGAEAVFNTKFYFSEIAATHPNWRVDGIIGHNFYLQNVNIHHVVDSVKVDEKGFGNVLIKNSWLHHNYYSPTTDANHDTHSDNLQIQSGSNIHVYGTVFNSNTTYNNKNVQNAAVMITQDNGAVSDVHFRGNYLDYGYCTVNVEDAFGRNDSKRNYGPVENLVIEDNWFGKHGVLRDGKPCAIAMSPRNKNIATVRNNFYTDGTAVPITRGAAP